LYYDTVLEKDVVYDDTQMLVRNEIDGHKCHCGSFSYTAATAKTIGGCYRATNCPIRVLSGFYTTMQYAAAVRRTVNDMLAKIDIAKTDASASFAFFFGMDGRGHSRLTAHQRSSITSVQFRKGSGHCRMLGLGTENEPLTVLTGTTTPHPDPPDASAGAASRVVHIRLLELEGTLCAPQGPWRSFVIDDSQSVLTYASPHKEDAYASARATKFHQASKRTLTELRSVTVRLSDGNGSPLPYVAPGAILLLNVSYLHAAIDVGRGPLAI
jgi:hypothetical protein